MMENSHDGCSVEYSRSSVNNDLDFEQACLVRDSRFASKLSIYLNLELLFHTSDHLHSYSSFCLSSSQFAAESSISDSPGPESFPVQWQLIHVQVVRGKLNLNTCQKLENMNSHCEEAQTKII